ncbi:uncharacterized protein LOC108732460 [Agrilus planipennis]|uniref:Oxidative stress-responsive serine-rich protein 1 n=1 Tax=Agrilus planipennis TaxID=224129 RepID=A0A7F5RLA8_AGRPL|nr:uncharacterized protein LOC108732460 [Agrilus planipennis]
MSEEDALLTQSLKKLKIESFNVNRLPLNSKSENGALDINTPMLRRRYKSLSNLEKCVCGKNNFLHVKPLPFKKSTAKNKLIRDPILNFVKYSNDKSRCDLETKCGTDKTFGECSMSKEQDFKSLVQACKRISLSYKTANYVQGYSTKSFRQHRLTKTKIEKAEEPHLSNTCAHQARLNMSPPCDVSIDELASYFETFVHIPKKMSVMAEMMYI